MVYDERVRAGLRSLLDDILGDAAAAEGECNAMRRNLDLYVHEELEGRDPAARQPALWAHLQGCAECRQQHDMLLTLLTAEARGELVPLPPRPLTAPAPPPWRLQLEAQPDGRPSLVFVFLPAYLHTSLHRERTAAGWRAAAGPAFAETLLLSYLGETPAGEAMVQVYARPAQDDPGQCLLTVIAAAEPMPRRAVLSWGDHTLETPLDPDGAGQLGPAPLSAFDNAAPDAFVLRLTWK